MRGGIAERLAGIHRPGEFGSVGAETTAPTGTSRGPAVAATANAARIRSSSVVTARACGHRPRRSITADSWSAKPISRAMRPSCSSA